LKRAFLTPTSWSKKMSLVYRATKGARLTIAEHDANLAHLQNTKVDKIPGKGLSANDFTDIYKTRLDQLISRLEFEELPFTPKVAGQIEQHGVNLVPLWGGTTGQDERLLTVLDHPFEDVATYTQHAAGAHFNAPLQTFADNRSAIVASVRESGVLVSTDGGQTFALRAAGLGTKAKYIPRTGGGRWFVFGDHFGGFNVSINDLTSHTSIAGSVTVINVDVAGNFEGAPFVAINNQGFGYRSTDGVTWTTGTQNTSLTSMANSFRTSTGEVYFFGHSTNIARFWPGHNTANPQPVALNVGSVQEIIEMPNGFLIGRGNGGIGIASVGASSAAVTWSNRLSGVTGTLFLPPGDPGTVLLLSGGSGVSGGVWRSTAATNYVTWTQIRADTVGTNPLTFNGVLNTGSHISADNGLTWEPILSPPTGASGFFVSRGRMIGHSASTKRAWHSYDGTTWDFVDTPYLPPANASPEVDGVRIGWGSSGFIYSTDGGLTWNRGAVELPANSFVRHIADNRFLISENATTVRLVRPSPNALRLTIDMTAPAP
jgi:hypothetical protein